MERKIRIQKVSTYSIAITIILGLLFTLICIMGEKEFHIVRDTTNQYIDCENAAKQLQNGSDYLTEQVRLYAMTSDITYMENYFKEANVTKRREEALKELKKYFDGTDTFNALKSALDYSQQLMRTEYYSMRLVCEANKVNQNKWPTEILNTKLSRTDESLSKEDKIQKAQKILCDENYVGTKTDITNKVMECTNDLITKTKNSQGRASSIFADMYLKLEIGIILQIILTLTICMLVRILVVKPLISYNESIKRGEIFPVIGAQELQNLARTYNKVFAQKQETEKLIRHEAEHDSLTDLLNRGSFEKVLDIYENGKNSFAMIIIDIDIFKSVNDTYGHAVGDIILKKVANLLQGAFRNIDYVCRIGGDEFAIIMVEMTSDLKYTIEDKIADVNKRLANPEEEGIPAVSLSVGVAFSDRENPGESIFKDADKALYYVKEHGRNGCGFY